MKNPPCVVISTNSEFFQNPFSKWKLVAAARVNSKDRLVLFAVLVVSNRCLTG